jgi:hypothetical protein
LWLWKLRKINGPSFTWPLLHFSSALSEKLMIGMAKIYPGRPIRIKGRRQLLASINLQFWKHLRLDTGDLPEEMSLMKIGAGVCPSAGK